MASRLARTPDVIERRVADETFLLPIRGALVNSVEMFALSEVGQFVWSRTDGTRGVPDIVAEVVAEFDVSEEQARLEVGEFIAQLQVYGLLQEVTD